MDTDAPGRGQFYHGNGYAVSVRGGTLRRPGIDRPGAALGYINKSFPMPQGQIITRGGRYFRRVDGRGTQFFILREMKVTVSQGNLPTAGTGRRHSGQRLKLRGMFRHCPTPQVQVQGGQGNGLAGRFGEQEKVGGRVVKGRPAVQGFRVIQVMVARQYYYRASEPGNLSQKELQGFVRHPGVVEDIAHDKQGVCGQSGGRVNYRPKGGRGPGRPPVRAQVGVGSVD